MVTALLMPKILVASTFETHKCKLVMFSDLFESVPMEIDIHRVHLVQWHDKSPLTLF